MSYDTTAIERLDMELREFLLARGVEAYAGAFSIGGPVAIFAYAVEDASERDRILVVSAAGGLNGLLTDLLRTTGPVLAQAENLDLKEVLGIEPVQPGTRQ